MAVNTKEPAIVKSSNSTIDQRYINAIEKLLSLRGGATPPEMGADLANRYGKIPPRLRDLQNQLVYSEREWDAYRRAMAQGRIKTKQPTIKEKDELRKLIGQAKEDAAKERGELTRLVMQYIVEVYGEERRDTMGNLSGYGDRIQYLPTRHLKKVW